MMQVLIPAAFAAIIFVLMAVILHFTGYKKDNAGCCSVPGTDHHHDRAGDKAHLCACTGEVIKAGAPCPKK